MGLRVLECIESHACHMMMLDGSGISKELSESERTMLKQLL